MSRKEIERVTINGITITSVDMESAYRTLDMDITMGSGLWNSESGSIYRIYQILDITIPEAVHICLLSLIHSNLYIDSYEGIVINSMDYGIESDAWKNLEFIVKCMEEKNLPINVYDEDEEEWTTINPYDCASTFGD